MSQTPLLETEEGRAFYQERIGLASRTLFWLSFGFLVVSNLVAMGFVGDYRLGNALRNPTNQWHAFACVVCFGVAHATRRASLRRVTLARLDALSLLALMTSYAAMGWTIPPPQHPHLVVIMIGMVAQMGRATVVPSSARTTLFIGVLASLPSLALAWHVGEQLASHRAVTHESLRALRALRGGLRLAVVRGHGGHGDPRVARHLRAARAGARGDAPRPVHARGQDRRGGHGHRVPREPRHVAPADRDQAAAPRQEQRAEPRALRARGAADESAHPPQHGRDLRLRAHARRGLLLRDGVPRRLRPAGARRRDRPPAAGARGAHPHPDRGGARRGAPHRARPPRHQARQRDPLRARRGPGHRQGARLRAREGAHAHRRRRRRRHGRAW